MEAKQSFLARHEFLIRRLHSLSGLVPVGAFMVVHLFTNASVLGASDGALFQQNVYRIHSLGPLLPLVEWTFIFTPLIFHAVIGVVIVKGGLPNHSSYTYASNIRYSLQRASGMIAFVFIFWHVFHMHGWFHADWWLESVAKPLGGAKFKPFSASSTAAEAMQTSFLIPLFYVVGVLASVFHLANGIWTMGITWGVWVSAQAQRRANWVAVAVGFVLAVAGLGAVQGFWAMDQEDIQAARQVETDMYDAKVAAQIIDENEEKRAEVSPTEEQDGDDSPEEVSSESDVAIDQPPTVTIPTGGKNTTETSELSDE